MSKRIVSTKRKYYLLLGGGVQSTALALMFINSDKRVKDYKLDAIIFSDTGSEMPYTYPIVDKLQKLSNGIDFHRVGREDGLYDYCETRNIIPTRSFRWCTDKFKIRTINKITKKGDILYFGITTDEAHRMKDNKQKRINKYPLVDLGFSRDDCYKIFEQYDFPIPGKSGCYICPYIGYNDAIKLKNNYPKLFEKAIHLQTINQKGMKLWSHEAMIPNHELNEYFEYDEYDECDGVCFT